MKNWGILFGALIGFLFLVFGAKSAFGSGAEGNADQSSNPGATGEDGNMGIDPNTINLEAKIEDAAHRTAVAEGFFVSGSRPARNNNPGDLEEEGDAGRDGPYAIFSSASIGAPYTGTGWDALRRQWRLMLTGASHVYSLDMTFSEVAAKWDTGTNEDGSATWPDWLRNAGFDPNQTLQDYVNS